jgi:hypothetical protein
MIGCVFFNARLPTPEEISAFGETGDLTASESLERGRSLTKGRCGKCHPLRDPRTRTAEEWEKIIDRMAGRAFLDEEQKRDVKNYHLAASRLQ